MLDIQPLLDREAIRDCIHRYCRGVDRADEAALRSAYWPDATDNHGAYSGSANGFIAFALELLRVTEPGIHQIHNMLIDFREGGALAETYFSAWQQLPSSEGFRWSHLKGRYVDWFEKREGEWRVKERRVVFDWMENAAGPLPGPQQSDDERLIGKHFPDDPIYRKTP